MDKEVEAIYWRGFSPAFIHPDDATCYVHGLIDKNREREYGGFILRREDHKFVATLPVGGNANNFHPNMIFPESDELPAGMEPYGGYHSHPSTQALDHLYGTELPWEKEWLQVLLNSPSAPDIYSAIYSREFWPALYLSAPDGALLKYMASGSQAEKSLEKRVKPISEDPVAEPESEISRAVAAGTMTDLDFIRLTAQAGRLSVVVGSPLWGNPKVITADWRPFQKEQAKDIAERPTLSPLFSQADDAARYFQERARDLDPSGAYAGFLLHNESDQTYLSTLPVIRPGSIAEVMAKPFLAKALFKLPDNFALIGLCLSMPKAAVEENTDQRIGQHFYDAEDISGFISLALHNPEIRHFYLAIEDGALLKFTVDKIKLAQGSYSKVYSGSRQEQRVTNLAELGALEVLTTGLLWTSKGIVTSDWTPLSVETGYKQHARTPITFSPLFKDANDAARYAHDAIRRSPQVGMLGFILKHPIQGTFIAAQPMQGPDAADVINAEESVFRSAEQEARTGNFRPLPDLPLGYVLDSLYIAQVHPDKPYPWSESQIRLFKNFFNPRHICFARERVSQVFLSAQGGALLRYRFSASRKAESELCARRKGTQWWDLASDVEKRLKEGGLQPVDYVRAVAEAGELFVLETGQCWPRHIIATPHWQLAD